MKNKKNLLKLMLILLLLVPVFSFAEESKTYTVKESINEKDKEYKNSEKSQNAILFLDGNSILSNINVEKSGDSNDNISNSAVVCLNNATLDISSSTINTNGSNSSGIVSAKGGIITAKELTITTKKEKSYCLVSQDDGDLSVDKGTYETKEKNSPVIYATSDVIVKNATLNALKSEAVITNGSRNVKLENVKLTSNDQNKNENTNSFMNIYIFNDNSKNDETKFDLYNSEVETNKGDTFLVSANATINIENNKIINNDNGAFIKIIKDNNFSFKDVNVTASLAKQKVAGNIVIDSASLYLNLNEKSVITGEINSDKKAKYVYLTISEDSVVNLTNDSYVDELSNAVSDNSNIYLNGHKLYVNNVEVKGNTGVYKEEKEKEEEQKEEESKTESKKKNNFIYIVLVVLVIVISVLFYFLKIKGKKKIEHNDNL